MHSDASSSLDIPAPRTAVRGGLRPFAKDDRAAGFLLHASPLAGIILPLIGHVGAPALVHRLMRDAHPALTAHWPAVRLDQLRWGIAGMLGYAAVGFLGMGGVFLALAVVVPWAITVVISASQAEGGQPVRRWWPGT